MKAKKLLYPLFLIALVALLGFTWPLSWLFTPLNNEQFGTESWLQKQVQIVTSQAGDLSPEVAKLSLVAYSKARLRGLDQKQLLTVIDYSKPSTQKRMWVFDLKRNKLLFATWVAHGKNSGGLNTTSFSNQTGSLKSSMGVFLTDRTPYQGGNGYSLRLVGLERGINDNAYNRNIVIHGAWYAHPDMIKSHGQLGRSWGCPAVADHLAKPIIDTIKDDTLVFAYYPDRNWLKHSAYLA